MPGEGRPTTRKDRFIAKVTWLVSRAIYREIDTNFSGGGVEGAPTLSVANHFGGLSDAIVLLQAFDRRPRIIARDVIWKVPLVGRLMTCVGAIPVHKPEDGVHESANDQMFGSCYSALADADHLLIFPEGVTRNEPSIARVKTGAARIVLGARASGVEAIEIQPVGIHYEDKAALRSRVVVTGAPPISLDDAADGLSHEDEPITAEDRSAVRNLTDDIDTALRQIAPDFEDWEEHHELTKAAEITLRSTLEDPRQAVPVGLRDRLANTLADRSADNRAAIRANVRSYSADLDGLGVTDAELSHRLNTGGFVHAALWHVLVGLVLLPFAMVGVAIHLLPYLAVKTVGLLKVAPSVHSTIKPVTAVLAFGITWIAVIWWTLSEFGLVGAAASVILLPVYLGAAIAISDRAVLVWRTYRRWRVTPRALRASERLQTERARLVASVLEP